MSTLVEFVKLVKRRGKLDLCVGQVARLRMTRPLVDALQHLGKRGTVKNARKVLAVEVNNVQHTARLVYESHMFDAAGVDDPVDLLDELLDSGALLASNSCLLSATIKSERACTDKGKRLVQSRLNNKLEEAA